MSTALSTLTPSADDAYSRSLLDAQCDPRAAAAQAAERAQQAADAQTVRQMVNNSGHTFADRRLILETLGLLP
jgi:hypothetical protein